MDIQQLVRTTVRQLDGDPEAAIDHIITVLSSCLDEGSLVLPEGATEEDLVESVSQMVGKEMFR